MPTTTEEILAKLHKMVDVMAPSFAAQLASNDQATMLLSTKPLNADGLRIYLTIGADFLKGDDREKPNDQTSWSSES